MLTNREKQFPSSSGATYKTGQNSAVACNFAANGYRLPTEAEWEKAARGGLSGQNFPWGEKINHSKANYYSYTYSYEDDPKEEGFHPSYTAGGYPYSAPVDSFGPNAYGLFNMSGNVWEWCWDWYGSYSSASLTNPNGPASGIHRAIRGSSWLFDANDCRVAHRNYNGPTSGDMYDFGFRIAHSSGPLKQQGVEPRSNFE